MKNEILWDAYNNTPYGNQELIGTITTNAGQTSMRGGWHLIEVYEE